MEKRGFIEQENSSCLWIKPNNHCISFYRSDLQVPLHTFSDKGTVHCLQPPTKPTNRDLDFCYRHNKNTIHGEEKWEEKKATAMFCVAKCTTVSVLPSSTRGVPSGWLGTSFIERLPFGRNHRRLHDNHLHWYTYIHSWMYMSVSICKAIV